ncbi:MAG: hypothetical protein ACTHN5_11615 [Phycisphaerae bacterium]
MPIHAVCPSCSSPFVLADDLAGSLFTCTNCQTPIKLPEPAPQPLPPPSPELYRRVAGARLPLFLSLLGLDAIQESLDQGVLATLWASRHLFLLLSAFIFIVVYASSSESALIGGPVFFLVSALLLILGYAAAVSVASRQFADLPRHTSPLTRLLLQPLLIFFADPEAALPSLRFLFFALVISLGTLLLGLRAGAVSSVVPSVDLHLNSPQRAYSDAAPSAPPAAPIHFNPTGAEQPAAEQSPAPAAAPAAASVRPAPHAAETPAPPPPPESPAPSDQTANAQPQGPPPPPEE